MLVRFSAENYKSLRDVCELSLVATSLRDSGEAPLEIPGFPYGILRVAAIYGANASGKSNVLGSLGFLSSAVQHSHKGWKPEGPIPCPRFLLDESKDKPSTFEVEFILDSTRYRYGFAVGATEVLREWLYAFPHGRSQLWFNRDVGRAPKFRFGKSFSGENKTIESLTRPNSLFLSAAAQNNHALLSPLYKWLSEGLQVVSGPRAFAIASSIAMCQDEATKRTLMEFMSSADLGVKGILTKEEDMPEPVRKFAVAIWDALPQEFRAEQKMPETVPKVQFVHTAKDGKEVPLDIGDESAGTTAFFSLLGPALTVLRTGGVLCVDELDASLHPLLAVEVVRMFKDPARNPRGAQLIFNTHDTNILDPSVLRRDEIWFTEKDRDGCTHLYPLSDFARTPRRRENLKRGYLQGRYGAVPFVTLPEGTSEGKSDE